MPRTIKNTIANFGGVFATSILTLLFSAVYYRVLGSENFGLISFCTTILLVGNLFADLGLGRTVIRELARREHNPKLANEMRDALYTLQLVQFALAIGCGAIILGSSSWLAVHWLRTDTVETSAAIQAISLLGVVAALQLPREFCRSALGGLQRQVLSNVLATTFSTLRGLTTVAALLWIAPTPTIFLIVQAIVSGFETSTFFAAVWLHMPKKERSLRFDPNLIRETWRFALGDGLAVLLGVGMTLGDRILLSRLLPLNYFGNYTLAILLAEVILRLVSPFSSAFLPHFSDLIARNEQSALSEDYRRVSVIVSAVLIPAALVLAFFSLPIFELVTGSAAIAVLFAPVLAIRALGNAIAGLQYLPHTLQLAAGISVAALVLNIINVCLYIPGILYLTPIYGFLVPVILWLAIETIQSPIMIFITHRILLKGEGWVWTKESIIQPALISVAFVCVSAYFRPDAVTWLVYFPWLLVTYVVAMTAVLVFSARTRPAVVKLFYRLI